MSTIFNKNLLIAILIFGATLTTFAQVNRTPQQISTFQVVTVDDAVQIALDNNLSLKRAALNTGTLKRAADRSWNSLLPTVSVGVMVNHPTSFTPDLFPDQMMGLHGLQDRNVWTPGLSLSAGITLSTATIENIKRAQSDYEVGLLTYEAARQELEFQVRMLFYQILLLDANRELAVQNFQSAQIRYEQTAARVRTGQAPRLDELSARVDMENLRPNMINAEIIYENVLDSFKAILGIPPETEIKLDGDLSVWIMRDITTAKAESNVSFDVSRQLASIRSMEAQRNAVRNNAYIPSLRLSWNSTPIYNLEHGKWGDPNGSFTVSLGMNLDSFFPWSNARTQIQTLNDNLLSAEIQLTDSLRNRDNRINQNIRTIERILESLEAMELNVELAQATYEMIEDAFLRGTADYQRLRGAGDSLAMAQNRLLQEQFNLIIALLDMEKELNIPFGTLSK